MLLAGAGVVWETGCSLVLALVLGSDSADLPGFGKQGRGLGGGRPQSGISGCSMEGLPALCRLDPQGELGAEFSGSGSLR